MVYPVRGVLSIASNDRSTAAQRCYCKAAASDASADAKAAVGGLALQDVEQTLFMAESRGR